MNKNCCVESLGGAPDRLKRGIVEIQRIDSPGMRVWIHVRADLCAAQAQLTDASFQFACSQIPILHWDCRQACASLRMITNIPGTVVVYSPDKVQPISGFRTVAKHNRHCRE